MANQYEVLGKAPESEDLKKLSSDNVHLTIKNLSAGYGKMEILHNFDLFVSRAQSLCLIGPNGAGKSTVLKTIYKDIPIGEGKLYINGEDVGKIRRRHIPRFRRKIGMVFQDYRLIPDRTVFENVALPLQIEGKSKKVIDDYVEELLEKVGLVERIKYYPGQLSGGEKQRVSIARALVKKPVVILADEPTGNLDPGTAEKVFDGLLALNRSIGSSLIVVTHNHGLANTLDRQVLLDQGRIKEQQSS